MKNFEIEATKAKIVSGFEEETPISYGAEKFHQKIPKIMVRHELIKYYVMNMIYSNNFLGKRSNLLKIWLQSTVAPLNSSLMSL